MRERFPSRSLLLPQAGRICSGFFIAVLVKQVLTHQSVPAVRTSVGPSQHRGSNGQDRQARRAGRQHFPVLKFERGQGVAVGVTCTIGRVPVEHGPSARTQRRPAHQEREQQPHQHTGIEGLQEVQEREQSKQHAGGEQDKDGRPIRPRSSISIPRIDGEPGEHRATQKRSPNDVLVQQPKSPKSGVEQINHDGAVHKNDETRSSMNVGDGVACIGSGRC